MDIIKDVLNKLYIFTAIIKEISLFIKINFGHYKLLSLDNFHKFCGNLLPLYSVINKREIWLTSFWIKKELLLNAACCKSGWHALYCTGKSYRLSNYIWESFLDTSSIPFSVSELIFYLLMDGIYDSSSSSSWPSSITPSS